MSKVTVCIPAYKSGFLLKRTLQSLVRQTHSDYIAHIAVEPPNNDTLSFIAPFLTDKRFQVSTNCVRLGWDANIRNLLEQVETPFFFILPHDDLIHPRYIELLLAEFEKDDKAVVAYADMHVFGNGVPYRKMVDLPRDGNREEQILAFFLAGAEAVPWRGLTRSSVISQIGGFPTDGFMGFAVECEWALALITQGRAIRLPRKLYFKQLYHCDETSASRDRIFNQSHDLRVAAWVRHRIAMFRILNKAVSNFSSLKEIIEISAEAAMLRRYCQFVGPLNTNSLQNMVTNLTRRLFECKNEDSEVVRTIEVMLSECAD
jgi:glycosyltransferase involved in cell wall biosynthesis